MQRASAERPLVRLLLLCAAPPAPLLGATQPGDDVPTGCTTTLRGMPHACSNGAVVCGGSAASMVVKMLALSDQLNLFFLLAGCWKLECLHQNTRTTKISYMHNHHSLVAGQACSVKSSWLLLPPDAAPPAAPAISAPRPTFAEGPGDGRERVGTARVFDRGRRQSLLEV